MEPNKNDNLRTKIKQMRKKKQLTLEELAQEIDMSYMSLSRFETGKRIPSDKTLKKLAQFYNIPTSYFLEYSGYQYDYFKINLLKLNNYENDMLIGIPSDETTQIFDCYRLKFSGENNNFVHIFQDIGNYALKGIGNTLGNLDESLLKEFVFECFEKSGILFEEITAIFIYTVSKKPFEIETIIIDKTVSQDKLFADFDPYEDSSNLIFSENNEIFKNIFENNSFVGTDLLDYGQLDYTYIRMLSIHSKY